MNDWKKKTNLNAWCGPNICLILGLTPRTQQLFRSGAHQCTMAWSKTKRRWQQYDQHPRINTTASHQLHGYQNPTTGVTTNQSQLPKSCVLCFKPCSPNDTWSLLVRTFLRTLAYEVLFHSSYSYLENQHVFLLPTSYWLFTNGGHRGRDQVFCATHRRQASWLGICIKLQCGRVQIWPCIRINAYVKEKRR